MAQDWQFLPYDLRWLEKLQQEYNGGSDCEATPIVFTPVESQQLVLYEWNGEQFLKILSSIVKGAQLSYPDNWMQIVQWILEGVDCPMSICDKVAGCIENSDAVRSALADFNSQWQAQQQYQPLSSTNMTGALDAGFNTTCDINVVWSECLRVVTTANQFIVDLLQKLTTADTVAKIAGVVAALPGLENLGIGTVTNIAQLLISLPLASYQADYTETLGGWRDTAACELFCLCKADCQVTMERVFGVFNARIEGSVPELTPPIDTWDYVAWAAAFVGYVAELSALNKADVAFYLLFGGLRFGDVVLGAGGGIRLLQAAVIIASDEPNNDWLTLCDDCPTCPSWEFAANRFSDIWTIRIYTGLDMGKYTAGVGYESVSAGMGGFQQNQIFVNLDDTGDGCDVIGVHWYQSGAMSGGVRAVYWWNSTTNVATFIGNLSDTNSTGSKYATLAFNPATRPSGANNLLIALSNTNLSVKTKITGVEFA